MTAGSPTRTKRGSSSTSHLDSRHPPNPPSHTMLPLLLTTAVLAGMAVTASPVQLIQRADSASVELSIAKEGGNVRPAAWPPHLPPSISADLFMVDIFSRVFSPLERTEDGVSCECDLLPFLLRHTRADDLLLLSLGSRTSTTQETEVSTLRSSRTVRPISLRPLSSAVCV